MPYARIVVTFNNGTESEILVTYKPGTLDKVAHHFQEAERKYWDGWKRPTGVTYQALNADNVVDALVASAALARLMHIEY